jgi:hypothetical protein
MYFLLSIASVFSTYPFAEYAQQLLNAIVGNNESFVKKLLKNEEKSLLTSEEKDAIARASDYKVKSYRVEYFGLSKKYTGFGLSIAGIASMIWSWKTPFERIPGKTVPITVDVALPGGQMAQAQKLASYPPSYRPTLRAYCLLIGGLFLLTKGLDDCGSFINFLQAQRINGLIKKNL